MPTCLPHKFIPVFLGAEAAAALVGPECEWADAQEQWTECGRCPVEHFNGSCHLYVWPCGVVLFHLVEELTLESVAELAVWRRMSYEQNMRQARDYLEALIDGEVASELYVLSLYWLDKPAWHVRDLDTALRLMYSPRARAASRRDRQIVRARLTAHNAGLFVASRFIGASKIIRTADLPPWVLPSPA